VAYIESANVILGAITALKNIVCGVYVLWRHSYANSTKSQNADANRMKILVKILSTSLLIDVATGLAIVPRMNGWRAPNLVGCFRYGPPAMCL
jgi:hypothetical protein